MRISIKFVAILIISGCWLDGFASSDGFKETIGEIVDVYELDDGTFAYTLVHYGYKASSEGQNVESIKKKFSTQYLGKRMKPIEGQKVKVEYRVHFPEYARLIESVRYEGSDENANRKRPTISIKPNQVIKSPVLIKLNSEGLWRPHEGELGVVRIKDGNNNELGYAILKSIDRGLVWPSRSDRYYAVLKFDAKGAKSGILRVEPNDPRDSSSDQSFEIAINIDG